MYVFGVLHAELLTTNTQRNIGERFTWLLNKVQGGDKKIIDESLVQDGDELVKSIDSLVMACLKVDPHERPDMKDVLLGLLNLPKGRKRAQHNQVLREGECSLKNIHAHCALKR